MGIIAVWSIDINFFCRIVVCTIRQSHAFCNSHYLFTLLFLSEQTRHRKKIVSFDFFLFVSGRAKCLSREQCVGS